MPDISNKSPSDKSARFAVLCWARAQLYAAGDLELHAAVDALQARAVRDGLVTDIGQDAVQAIMAQAFTEVRHDL
jgi:hypothetical protein